MKLKKEKPKIINKVLLTWPANKNEVKKVKEALPSKTELVVPACTDSQMSHYFCPTEILSEEANDAEIMIGWVTPSKVIQKSKKMKLVILLRSNFSGLDFNLLREKNVKVATVNYDYADSKSEYALALAICLAKKIIQNNKSAITSEWHPIWDPQFTTMKLAGKTICVTDLGPVAREIARRGDALNMKVVAIAKDFAIETLRLECTYPPEDIKSAFSSSDFIILTNSVVGSKLLQINESELKLMKREAFLINITTANIVSEAALYKALTQGWIAGYGSDVWWDYTDSIPEHKSLPTLSRMGVHNLPNVIATLNAATDSIEEKDKLLDEGLDLLKNYFSGKPLKNLFDPRKGF